MELVTRLENVHATSMLLVKNVIPVLTPFLVGHHVQKVNLQIFFFDMFPVMLNTSISECNCNPAGTEGGDATCDDNGQCHCKCDVTGLQCDTCEIGHQGFPDCHGK